MRILLLGASGFVGGALYQAFSGRYDVVGTCGTRPVPGLLPLDLRDDVTLAALAADGFDLIIHAAGVVDLATAEQHPDQAWDVNVAPIRVLTRAAPPGTWILFLSTDNVFDGTRERYTEDDACTPINTYGRTKVAAERALLDDPRHLVVRIPLVFGSSPYADRFLDRFRDPVTPARTDLICTPVYLPALARDLPRLWHRTGVLHYGGAEPVTRYALMTAVSTALGLPTEVRPVSGESPDTAVRRPPRLLLRSTRHTLTSPGLTAALRHWRQVIARNDTAFAG